MKCNKCGVDNELLDKGLARLMKTLTFAMIFLFLAGLYAGWLLGKI